MNLPPPSVAAPLRVVAYACVDSSVRYLGNKTLYVDGELLGPVPCLAICHDPKTNEFSVAHCNNEWQLKGIAGGYPSSEKAKEAIERTYQGISGKWAETGYKEEDVARFLEESYAEYKCSSCGKRPDEVKSMVRSSTANICNECVVDFYKDMGAKTDA